MVPQPSTCGQRTWRSWNPGVGHTGSFQQDPAGGRGGGTATQAQRLACEGWSFLARTPERSFRCWPIHLSRRVLARRPPAPREPPSRSSKDTRCPHSCPSRTAPPSPRPPDFHVDFFTAEMGINGYTQTPEPPPGGKRQILIMLQPKGRGAYKQPSGEQIKGWPQPVYKKKREATTQMLPKHAGGHDSGWKSTLRDPLYLDVARSRKGHCFFEEMGTPLPGSTHPDHNANLSSDKMT